MYVRTVFLYLLSFLLILLLTLLLTDSLVTFWTLPTRFAFAEPP